MLMFSALPASDALATVQKGMLLVQFEPAGETLGLACDVECAEVPAL